MTQGLSAAWVTLEFIGKWNHASGHLYFEGGDNRNGSGKANCLATIWKPVASIVSDLEKAMAARFAAYMKLLACERPVFKAMFGLRS